MNSEVLMQNLRKMLKCEQLKEQIVELLKTPDDSKASFFRKVSNVININY